MNYILKEKSWIWKLTGPFASNNNTTIYTTIYHPKGRPPSQTVINHECVHIKQQLEVGLIKFLALYLLCAPFFWNPWRWKWEYEAYTQGSKYSDEMTRFILRSQSYGWLKNG